MNQDLKELTDQLFQEQLKIEQEEPKLYEPDFSGPVLSKKNSRLEFLSILRKTIFEYDFYIEKLSNFLDKVSVTFEDYKSDNEDDQNLINDFRNDLSVVIHEQDKGFYGFLDDHLRSSKYLNYQNLPWFNLPLNEAVQGNIDLND